jgi:hypothetical protein
VRPSRIEAAIIIQHQQRAQAQHQRTHRHLHELGDGADQAGLLAGVGLQAEKGAVQPEPALEQMRQHAHRFDHFGIAQVVGGQGVGLDRHRVGLGQRRLGDAFVDHGQQHQQHGAGQRKRAQHRLEDEDHDQVDREPGRVEKGEQRIPGKELADAGQIRQRLARVAAGLLQVLLEGGGVHALAQPDVELGTDAHQHERTDQFQAAHEQVGADDQQGQHQQRDFVAAGQHAVVHLQHVQRRRQQQQVDDRAERADREEGALEGPQHLVELAPLFQRCFHKGNGGDSEKLILVNYGPKVSHHGLGVTFGGRVQWRTGHNSCHTKIKDLQASKRFGLPGRPRLAQRKPGA